MQDLAAFAQRYTRFLNFLKFQQALLPIPLASTLAARSAVYLSPHSSLHDTVTQRLHSVLDCSPQELDTLWQRYLRHSGTADLLSTYYRQMTPEWIGRYIHVPQQDLLKEQVSHGRGLLLMTYHNHYPHFLTAIMGLLGYRTHMVALDYRANPLYPYMSQVADDFHQDCSSCFHGGEYLIVGDKTPVSSMRALYKALNQGDIVVSANDYPSPFASKRDLPIEIFGRSYACPVGSLTMALQQQAHIAAAWVRGSGRGQFQVEIHPLQGDSVATVMADYLDKLQLMIELDPVLWEGWKWLPE